MVLTVAVTAGAGAVYMVLGKPHHAAPAAKG
jgi:hypothetical protein